MRHDTMGQPGDWIKFLSCNNFKTMILIIFANIRRNNNDFWFQELIKGAQGPEVEELQIRLAGFRGTIWDGDYGPGTELQVKAFQRDYMKMSNPSGIVEKCNFQIGWGASNMKALGPSHIAPSWVHLDIRCYSSNYL